METVQWGIIGCGDVTEIKSGPAFNKVPNSRLVAVMRRNGQKAADYALRHNVPKWYDNVNDLINDPAVNAVYVATPPLQHEEYTLAALRAGKPVYVEKPMAVDAIAGSNMSDVSRKLHVKLSVAHYRREMPVFKRIRQLLGEKIIGEIRFVDLQYLKPALPAAELARPDIQWRIDPAVAGGGLFHDLAPHQLDLMLYYFGKIQQVSGIALNQAALYKADDLVTGSILFENGIVFSGRWCFTMPAHEAKDECTIVGSGGKITFSVFGDFIIYITKDGVTSKEEFEKPQHVQQHMIEKVVGYFLGTGDNPCSPEDGVAVMQMIDKMTGQPNNRVRL